MTLELIASRAEAQPLVDLECFTLSMAENLDGTGWALMISCGLESGDDPIGPYDITTHEGVTFYGGIEDWERVGSRVNFSITADAAATLGLDEIFGVLFAKPETAELVDAALARITDQH